MRNSKRALRINETTPKNKTRHIPRSLLWGPLDSSYAVYYESTKRHFINFYENNWSKAKSSGSLREFNLIKLDKTKGHTQDEFWMAKFPMIYLDERTIAIGAQNPGHSNFEIYDVSWNRKEFDLPYFFPIKYKSIL